MGRRDIRYGNWESNGIRHYGTFEMALMMDLIPHSGCPLARMGLAALASFVLVPHCRYI